MSLSTWVEYRESWWPKQVRLSISLAVLVAVFLLAGCTQNQSKHPQTSEYTCTVVNKEVKSYSYILEITSPERHEYAEIAKEHWDAIAIGDSVTFNQMNVLVRINNEPID